MDCSPQNQQWHLARCAQSAQLTAELNVNSVYFL